MGHRPMKTSTPFVLPETSTPYERNTTQKKIYEVISMWPTRIVPNFSMYLPSRLLYLTDNLNLILQIYLSLSVNNLASLSIKWCATPPKLSAHHLHPPMCLWLRVFLFISLLTCINISNPPFLLTIYLLLYIFILYSY